MTDQLFQRGMAILAATWPDRKPTATTLEAYWMALHDLHDSTFEAAVAACLQSCTFYPKPAEIRAKAEAALTHSGVIPAGAEDAWNGLIAALKDWHPDIGWIAVHPKFPQLGRVGGMPCPLPKMVQEAVDAIGGMQRIYDAERENLGFLRRDFEQLYEAKRASEVALTPALLTQPLAALPAPREAA